ncbi:hypothetical protein GCM10009821_26820 [Aeromicrobium halocynthiae]|uniref:Uncharacterized protein n=1 Tax=Aeromicrobium halocynthiae TaxID=560557 RepID=A0ABP5HQ36_9ACTN
MLATVPVEPVAVVPVASLLAVAAGLVAAAAWRFERRDLATT